MTVWTDTTKNSASYSNPSKSASSWSDQSISVETFVLLIDDTFKFLIDDTYFLELGGVAASSWSNQSKS